MFVFRGEKLKDDGYVTKAREDHLIALKDLLERCKEELKELDKQEEELKNRESEFLEQYKIFKKPIKELTPVERKQIIERYKLFEKMWGAKPSPDEVYDDDEYLDFARSMIVPKDPLEEIKESKQMYFNMIRETQEDYKNNFTVALNKSDINKENIEILLNYINKDNALSN